ncbi:MAG: transcription-repair coupling factor, partial [Betaproteobacteria bacterium]
MAPPPPAPGGRFALPRPPGSADALLIAQAARAAHGRNQLTVVITADPHDAQRLVDEIAYFDPALAVRPLPDWETLPFDILSPHQDLVSERLEALYRLSNPDAGGLDVLVLPATTALYRLCPKSYIAGHTFFFRQGQRLAGQKLREDLVLAGYQHVSQVVAPGEFSVRGGLIDLFPMGSSLPYRLDLFDEAIETIKAFDPDSQRSLYPVPEVRLLPGREFPLDEAARTAFRGRFREVFEGDPSRVG